MSDRTGAGFVAAYGFKSKQVSVEQPVIRHYQRVRDRLLTENPAIEPVKLLIEPQDDVEIGAWPAKAHGILSVASKSVHIELPLHSALRSEESRNVYTRIVSELIKQAVRTLSN